MSKLYISLFVLVVVSCVFFITFKKQITIATNTESLTVKIPFKPIINVMNDYEIVIGSDNKPMSAEIHFNAFDRPLFFMISPDNDTLLVFYWYDVKYIVFAIDLNAKTNEKPTENLYPEIPVSSCNNCSARMATGNEVYLMVDEISRMQINKFYNSSIPCFDMGVYKRYITRDKAIKIIKDLSSQK